MVAAFVLIAGVMFVMIVGAVVFIATGMAHVLITLVPLAPWLIMVGSLLLILAELILFLGGKDDRRAAWRDMSYLIPTFVISGLIWFGVQKLF